MRVASLRTCHDALGIASTSSWGIGGPCCGAAAGCLAGLAVKSQNGPIPAAALKDDLALWRSAVLERDPRFYRQSALDAPTEAAFARALQSADHPMSRQQAFRLFAKMNPLFRDAHTLLLPWLSGEEPGDGEAQSQFPFGVVITPNERLLLRSNWREERTGSELEQGSEILSINGIVSKRILGNLLPYSHGETQKLRMHMLSVMLPEWLDAIMGWRDRFTISLAHGSGQRNLQWLKGAAWKPVESARHADMPSVEWLNEASALLRVPTFDVDEYPEAFNNAVDAAFRQIRIKNVQHLIIDVCGNTGGQSDAGAKIIQRFLDKPSAQVSRARTAEQR